jgi:arylsulfatase A-like enzyme
LNSLPSHFVRAPWRAAVGALVAAACAAPPAPLPPERLALSELSPPRAIVETAAIDIGDASAREHLESGWGADETSPEGSFAWSGGGAAVVRFEVVEPRDATFALRGWAYPLPDEAEQSIAARLDGVELARFALPRQPTTIRLPVPAQRLAAGEHRLELVPSRLARAGEPAWAAAWDALRLQAAPPAAPPRVEPSGELVLPARTALAWTDELPAGTWMAWDAVTRAGAATLEVAVRVEQGEARAERFTGGGRIRLTADRAALVEVALRSLGTGELRVAGARLHRPASPPPAAPASAAVAGARPNLVVYVVDTLRADHLGCYGYERPTSPRLDAFAREAVRWSEARAQSSWTKPAMATLLTGHYPITHGADLRARGLAEGIESIGGRLAAAGYESAFFTTNPTVTASFGFDRGFSTYRYLSRAEGRRRRSVGADEIHAEVVDWLARRDVAKPFLLVVHTLDPHDPYFPGEPYKSRFAPDVDPEIAGYVRGEELALLAEEPARERARQMRALYDAEIAQNDAAFGALLDELDRRRLAPTTAVLFTSDHGEEFFDHGGWRHAETLYEEVLRVPLLLRLPGGAHGGRRIDAPADQIDVAPTLLDLAGVAVPAELPGASWLPALAGNAPPGGESLAWLEHPSLSLASATRDGWKWIRNRGAWRPPLTRGPDELYHLARDGGERVDLTAKEPRRRHWLAGRLAAAVARHRRAAGAEVPIDPELDRALRALGYL